MGGLLYKYIHTASQAALQLLLLTLNKYCFGALRALETPEEKLVRRAIRNEKDRARRRRAKETETGSKVKNLTVTGNMHRSLRYFVLLEHITS